MLTICNRTDLLKGVNTVSKAVSNKTTSPILECILLDAEGATLTLLGNDLELGIETKIEAVVKKEGCIAVNARIFSEIIRRLPDEDIKIEVDDTYTITIECARSKFNIAGQSGDDFPRLPQMQTKQQIILSQGTFKDMIHNTIFSTAPEDSGRPILTGELMDIRDGYLYLVAVDGYHISILPILLGDGIRLFQTSEKERKLRLIRTESENGITGLVYVRRNASGNTSGNVHENRIRKFTPDDMEQVMEIWLNGNLEAHAFIPREYWESNAEAVKEQLLQAEIFICEEEGKIQGFAGLQGNYLAGIFVEAGSRSKGVGRELLNRVKETHPSFSLHVYAENERAVSFYRREGLTVVSREMEEDTGRMEYTMEWCSPVSQDFQTS